LICLTYYNRKFRFKLTPYIEPRVKKKEPRVKSQESRAKNKEPRVKKKEPRIRT